MKYSYRPCFHRAALVIALIVCFAVLTTGCRGETKSAERPVGFNAAYTELEPADWELDQAIYLWDSDIGAVLDGKMSPEDYRLLADDRKATIKSSWDKVASAAMDVAAFEEDPTWGDVAMRTSEIVALKRAQLACLGEMERALDLAENTLSFEQREALYMSQATRFNELSQARKNKARELGEAMKKASNR